ncbi:transporting ATPase [Mangrovimicrobium sediminis]|uniref:Transporting ATPase n=1 Tax=Mangrovimicrobium sediminis TaxID=2562682 RepID=A0A4Z0M751_9GAMM|nr:elongation factor P hydroxylase [Haliea sp. SAOS-164]TGD75236.1 transporting ATPase [Haliea sp. SAOS-164]
MGSALPHTRFDSRDLERLFNRCFADSENTRLFGGAAEPVYLPPAADGACAQLHYREDFFASALHEIAHWCIAGTERRQQLDFGYWYASEGRSPQQQAAFEAVEVTPQALEWILSSACGYRFRVSVDNFSDDGTPADTAGFRELVAARARAWQQASLPPRAARFFTALADHYRPGLSLAALEFDSRAVQ